MQKKSISALALCLIVGTAVPAFAQSSMSVDWEWKLDHGRCIGSGKSPALFVSGIPVGTKSLAVQMSDLDNGKDHGGSRVPHVGNSTAAIAEGALKDDYSGPCPPNMHFGHTYQFTVRALAADGAELAKGVKVKDFSAVTAK